MDEFEKVTRLYNEIQIEDYVTEIDELSECIYHYTGSKGLLGILGNELFHLRDRIYLNDRTEGVHVLKVCLELIQDKLDTPFYNDLYNECKRKINNPDFSKFHTYQISFSLNGDSLPLWNYYTKSDNIEGYNIKFNTKKLIKSLCKNVKQKENMNSKPKVYGGKVIYDEKKQKEIINDIISKFKIIYENNMYARRDAIDLLVKKLLIIGVFIKNKCFECENEYRLIIDLWINDKGEYITIDNKIGYDIKNGLIIPYIEIKFDKDAVEGLTISPTLNSNIIKQNLAAFTKKYNNIKEDSIKESEIPLRY